MTTLQYERWKDFALRMARTCFRRQRRPNAEWIVDVVTDFFDVFDEHCIECIIDWDHSTAFPEGNRYHGREYNLSYCGCDGYRHTHGAPNAKCEDCRGTGLHHRLLEASLVCDDVTEFLYEYQAAPPRCKACSYPYGDSYCRCEQIADAFYEKWDERWGDKVRCCVCAGVDFASAPSAGVIGFTAADVRRMFPEGVPEWVFPPDERLNYWLSDKKNGTFRELPDDAGVVL